MGLNVHILGLHGYTAGGCCLVETEQCVFDHVLVVFVLDSTDHVEHGSGDVTDDVTVYGHGFVDLGVDQDQGVGGYGV